MLKETYYFSHDQNARHDPKISAMILKYGMSGYGMFWVIIEMMKEDEKCKLSAKSYICNAIALQTLATPEQISTYLKDCIEEYKLFESDGEFFWSNSLIRRMDERKKISENRSKSAKKRWGDASVMQNNTDAMQIDAIKGKERKVYSATKKHSFQKSPYYDFDKFKSELTDWPLDKIKQYYDKAVYYSEANGGKYLNWLMAIKNWERKDCDKQSLQVPQRKLVM